MRKGPLTVCMLAILCHLGASAQQPTTIPGLATYFEEAYWRYPNIPKGVLEAAAYSASRITNLQPQNNDLHNCTGMPERYGLFGLVENGRGYFRNNLWIICHASNITPEQFKKDVRLQILAVAKYLGREATARRMSIQVSAEEFAGVMEILSEIPDDSSEVNNYARSLYTYDIYDHLQKGFKTPSLSQPSTPVELNKIFPAPMLQRLKAKEIEINYDKDSVLLYNRPTGPGDPSTSPDPLASPGTSPVLVVNDLTPGSSGSISAHAVESADYGPAIFVQANAGNYHSGRNGTKITNVTIHTTQGSYAGTISWFKNPAAVVSAHYVIRSSDGQITQMVRETDMAYHVRSANPYTIGIEHEGYVEQGTKWYTEQLYQSSAALVRDICNSRSIDRAACYRGQATAGTNFLPISVRIKGHQHYSGNTHTDPGKYWNWGKYADLILDKTNPEPEAKFVTIPNGVYRVNSVSSNKVMNARDCGSGQSTKVTQLPWSGRDCQRWLFWNVGDGWYKITNQLSGRVLDLPACSKDNVQVQLYDPKNNDCQKWRLFETGQKGQLRLVNKASGKVLEVTNGSGNNDVTIQQNTWSDKNYQKWVLVPVSPNDMQSGIYRLRMLQSGKVLTSFSCSTSPGTTMQQWDWKGLSCQRWQVEATQDGYFRLVQRQNSLVLDVEKCNNEKGGAIIQYNWLNNDCQKWSFERISDSTYKIVSKSSGKVLDVADNNNGTTVYQWDWHGGKNQQWILELVKGEDSMVVAPNPIAGNEIRVNYFLNNIPQPATLLLSDTYGRIIQQRRLQLQQGNNRLNVNTSLLKAGVYLVTVQMDGGGVSRKIIKP